MNALTQALAGDLAWFIIIASALFWAGVLTAKAVRISRRLDRDLPALLDPPTRATCQIGDCTGPAVATYDKHPSGTIRVCASHDQRIQRMAPATQAVYDQQSDLALWEREVGS